jgi:hydroxymethylbilane synthase
MISKIIVGSRGSKLALLQTNMVIEKLKSINPCLEFEVKTIKTKGDKILDKSLSKIGGKGLFIEEIENRLRSGEIDVAVHSMKDVQNSVSEEFCILTALEREDPRDALISRDNVKLLNLPKGSVIGTSSLRRIVQLRNIRKDLEFKALRGNVDTRINKLEAGEVDAIILAAAGLNRMGLQGKITEYLDFDKCIPSVGQGALCIEIRRDHEEIFNMVSKLANSSELRCVFAERAFLKEMNGGCTIAIGAHAVETEGEIKLEGFVCDDNNEVIFRNSACGKSEEYENIGIELGKKLKKQKAGE